MIPKYHSLQVVFVNCYCLKIAHKIHINSKFTTELEIFENWTLNGAQNAFHEN